MHCYIINNYLTRRLKSILSKIEVEFVKCVWPWINKLKKKNLPTKWDVSAVTWTIGFNLCKRFNEDSARFEPRVSSGAKNWAERSSWVKGSGSSTKRLLMPESTRFLATSQPRPFKPAIKTLKLKFKKNS